MMSGIRAKDTKIEIAVRRALHARGLRFRKDVRTLTGRPDIVLRRWHAVIFVHGCFWHAHDCGLCRIPKTRTEFWQNKLQSNAERDFRNVDSLLKEGWRVAIVWECALRGKGQQAVMEAAMKLDTWLRGADTAFEIRG